MADVVSVHTASALIYTGKGQVNAIVISCNNVAAACTLYDGLNDTGIKIFEALIATPIPLVVFFPERLAPSFVTGLYIKLAANLSATVWSRQV